MAIMAIVKNDCVVNFIVAEPTLTIPDFEVVPVQNSGIAGVGYWRDGAGNWLPPEPEASTIY